MPDKDLQAAWTVLATEAGGAASSEIKVVASGVQVLAGEVLVGVDALSHRHVLIPLRPGEAFAEDRRGRSVHLVKIHHAEATYLSAVCVDSDLYTVFAQFAAELLADVAGVSSPAKTTVAALDRWRRLFSDAATTGLLSEPRLIGLLAELMVLEQVVARDDNRRLSCWTGPEGSEHDFRAGPHAIEVKATLLREGRVVSISSIDQLDPPPGGTLHVAHHRFEPDPEGDSLPDAIDRVAGLGVPHSGILEKVSFLGYRTSDAALYRRRRYSLVDWRLYDVESPAFPRLVPGSFGSGVLPPGIVRVSYSIDLTNEPPTPLDHAGRDSVLQQLAGS